MFYREVLIKVNGRKHQIMLVAHNGTRFYIPFLFSKMEYYDVVPNLHFIFQFYTLKLAKVVLKNFPVPSKFKLKTIFEIPYRKVYG